jgi:hypothetical protein
MRKLIVAATALAFIASPAFAQTAGTDKGAAPAAGSADTGADTMKKAPKKKKTAKKKSGDDAMTNHSGDDAMTKH